MYPRTDRLLDNESASLGVFKPDVADPELSCADSAVLWELPVLSVSYFVRGNECHFFFVIRSTTIHWSVNMLCILALAVLHREREHYNLAFQDGEILLT